MLSMWYIYISKTVKVSPLLCFQNSKVWISALVEDRGGVAFMTSNPIKYERTPSVIQFQRSCIHILLFYNMYKKNSQSPITPINFVESKKHHNRLIHMSWLIILSNMNKFCHTVSEELHSQNVTDGGTETITISLCHGALGTTSLICMLSINRLKEKNSQQNLEDMLN
jgi:hypothetical protein